MDDVIYLLECKAEFEQRMDELPHGEVLIQSHKALHGREGRELQPALEQAATRTWKDHWRLAAQNYARVSGLQ